MNENNQNQKEKLTSALIGKKIGIMDIIQIAKRPEVMSMLSEIQTVIKRIENIEKMTAEIGKKVIETDKRIELIRQHLGV